MTDIATLQSLFCNSLLSEEKLPQGLVTDPVTEGERLAVYRNNVRVTLREVLRDRFAVVSQLVGEDFFNAMAGEYVRANLPASPVLLDYGAGFPDFIAGFSPAGSLPYLADVARLEWFIHDAANAPDATSLDPVGLSGLDSETMDDLFLKPHPSLRLFESPFPVHDIWRAHQDEIDEELLINDEACHLVICRPEFEVSVWSHSHAEYLLLSTLNDGLPLMDAMAEGLASDRTMSLDRLLAHAFSRGYFRSAYLPHDTSAPNNGDDHVR